MLRSAAMTGSNHVASMNSGNQASMVSGETHRLTTVTQPSSSRHHSVRAVGSGAVNKLDLDAAFFWLLLVFLVTVVSFLNLRSAHVELSPSQITEYERRTQALANSTVYIVEVHRPEGLLSKLKPEDWARVSKEVDYVAFVFDDLAVFLSDDWIARSERVLRDQKLPHGARVEAGLGILLFHCGCIIPNAYFAKVTERLGGLECILLPGWVLPHQDVHWMPDLDLEPKSSCRRQQRMTATRAVQEFSTQLASIRRTLEKIRADLPVTPALNTSARVLQPPSST